jgi:hypothetical protein
MQHLEVSGVVWPIYASLGFKGIKWPNCWLDNRGLPAKVREFPPLQSLWPDPGANPKFYTVGMTQRWTQLVFTKIPFSQYWSPGWPVHHVYVFMSLCVICYGPSLHVIRCRLWLLKLSIIVAWFYVFVEQNMDLTYIQDLSFVTWLHSADHLLIIQLWSWCVASHYAS